MDANELGRWTRFAAKGGIGKCTATQDCIAEGAEDLMFMKGDDIVVLMQLPGEDDMYLGYCESVVGRFRGSDVQFHSRLKKPVMTKRSSRSLSRSSSRPSSSQSNAAPLLVSKDPLPTMAQMQRTSPSLPPAPSRLSYSYSSTSISVTEDTSTTSTLSSPRHHHASPLMPSSPLLPPPVSLHEENQHFRSASHSSGSTALDSAPRTPADFGKEEQGGDLVRIVSLSRQVDSPTQLTEEGTLTRDASEELLAQVKAEAHRTQSQQTISAQRSPSPVSVKENEIPESPSWLDTSDDVSSRISVALSDGEVGIGLSLLNDFVGGDGDDASSTYSTPNRNSLATSLASGNAPAPTEAIRQSAVVSERSSVYSTASHSAGLEGPHPPFAASLRSTSSRASMHPSISDSEYGGEEWEGASDIYDNYRYSRYSVASKASRLSRGSMYTVASGLGLEPPPPVPSDGHRPSLDSVRQGAGRERLGSVTTTSSSVEEVRVVGSPHGSSSSLTSLRDVAEGKRVPPPLELSAARHTKQNSVVAMSSSPGSTTSPLLHGTFNSPMTSPASHSPSFLSPGSPPLTAPGFSNVPGGAASALRQRLAQAQDHATTPDPMEISEQGVNAQSRKSTVPSVVSDIEHERSYSQSQGHTSPVRSPPTSPTSPSAMSEKKRMIETTFYVANQAPPPPYTPTSSVAGSSSQTSGATASTSQPLRPGPAPSDRPVGVAIPRPQNAQNASNAFTRRSLFLPHPHAPKPAETPSGPMYGRQPMNQAPSGPVPGSVMHTLHMARAVYGDPARPRMVTIYGLCEPDLGSAIGPVPIRFALEPLNSIPANRARASGPAPFGFDARPVGPMGDVVQGAVGGSGAGAGAQQEQGSGKVIPRANFFPKTQTPRPRSRSFSGFDTVETEVIIPPEAESQGDQTATLHALTKRSKSTPFPSSSSSPALSHTVTPPATNQNVPATSATAKPIHKPSPLSLSQNNVVATAASPPLSPPVSPRVPSSPLAQPPVNAPSVAEMRPVSSTTEARQPSPNLSLGQASSVLTSPTLTSPTLPPEPPTARPVLRQVSSSSSGHSTPGPSTPVSPTKHRPFHVLRHSRSSTLSHRPSGSSSRDLSPQSRSSMQGRRSGETDASHASEARSILVSPTPSAPTVSLRSKLSLPTLKIKVNDRVSQHEDRSPTLSVTPSDYSDQPTVSVKDMNFELVKPVASLASISEDPLRSPPLPSPGVRSEFGSSLRPGSPATSMLSASSGRTSTTQAPEPVRRTPSIGPKPPEPQEVEAHRQRELRWISMMASVPASQARKNKKVRKLLWEGVPASVRYLVWAHLTDSKAKRMEGLYAKLVKRERVPASASIERDVNRVFASEPPLLDGSLVNLLQAYLSMVPDVQYGRGLTVIAGHLLLHSPEEDAFWTFVSLMDSHLRLYFSAHPVQMEVDASLFGKAVEANESAVAKKVFIDMAIPPASLCRPWFTALFMEALPSEHAQRVWDIFMFDGVAFLIRAGLAIIQCCKHQILKTPDREAILNTLLHPPASLLPTSPDAFLEMAAAVKLKDDDVRKQRIKLEAQVKRQTQARGHTVQVTASGVPPPISLPRS
ncbi:hypothetical protein EIP86_009438 [Pleurotus ostreatoroseus]|nr:hypothetical protein EIP86_009438 [Pleurotus ostreatoroseus]